VSGSLMTEAPVIRCIDHMSDLACSGHITDLGVCSQLNLQRKKGNYTCTQ
jgi:hypothetical protein